MAINISNGAVLWSYQSGGDIHSTPAVSNNIVYFGSYDNSLYAIDASSGSLVWRVQTSDHIQSSPAVTNGVVYVGSYDHFATTDTGVNNGLLYALDASTGKMLWSYPVGTEVLDSPIVADAVVYAGGYNTDFYALNASTGAKLWSYQIEFPSTYSWSSAAVARGVLYVDFEGGLPFCVWLFKFHSNANTYSWRSNRYNSDGCNR